MTDMDENTFEVELVEQDATLNIAKAVSARHSIARKYVMRARRRNPDATPAELIRLLERQYVTAISTAGAVIAAGAIVVDVGIALIPVAGAAAAGAKSASQQAAKKASKEAAKQAAKVAAKEATKAAAKDAALGVARTGARRVAALLPAGDEQLQFEITAIFGLAIADIHGMDLDKEQAHALVYGLSNGRVSQQQIATMATDLATVSTGGAVGVGHAIAAGRGDWSHWANTLADMLPGGAAQSLVGTIQTGQLDTLRLNLSGKQQATIEYGVGALAGGVTRFLFGREVVDAARVAFPDAPDKFPAHLAIPVKAKREDDDVKAEPNRALAALEGAAKATGNWISDAANAAGAGVVTAAGAVSRPFRSVDLDGDGIPDAPQALTAVKGVGGAIAGAAGAVGGAAVSLFKTKKLGRHATGVDQRQVADTATEAEE
ncbi:hypothetical protein Daura_48655 [Dactylosporangium aurantiacum]|uniref:Uncharacterized protein n=1 Tax=Dactylosporangium aurantiacum TaxID=35754 RepID=A0A9Q9MJ22_9ACTN|nr:hypothetical protein [Dactylosporangium aurantiacum]MDG6109635.1 hypothetical protein [Dactylosporangium aurantiacum]UWZ54251.1 hypothetical protein Daura_48655 [Dactylosporangium aurantiacum]